MRPSLALIATPLLLVACGSEPAPAAPGNAAETAAGTGALSAAQPADALLGHWTGVEGMVLDVAKGDQPGRYQLTMQWSLDDHGTYAGRGDGTTIGFEREGRTEILRPGTGEETGLKWLADKRDCVVVKESEGYCRG